MRSYSLIFWPDRCCVDRLKNNGTKCIIGKCLQQIQTKTIRNILISNISPQRNQCRLNTNNGRQFATSRNLEKNGSTQRAICYINRWRACRAWKTCYIDYGRFN